jgi:hypothetical protein
VLDCGSAACAPSQSYPVLADTPSFGEATFLASPGHDYSLVGEPVENESAGETVGFQYLVETPALGGTVGVAVLAGGAIVVLQAVRLPRFSPGAPAVQDP